jgi:hypothetical protein
VDTRRTTIVRFVGYWAVYAFVIGPLDGFSLWEAALWGIAFAFVVHLFVWVPTLAWRAFRRRRRRTSHFANPS